MTNFKKCILLVAMCVLAQPALAQNKKMDRLEMYYDQGNYEIAFRKSKRYLNKPEYDQFAAPAFYKALSVYRMSQAGDLKYTVDKSLIAYTDFLRAHPDKVFLKAHQSEINDYKNGILDHAARLKDLKQDKAAIALVSQVNTLFNEQHQYADLIRTPFKKDNPKDKSDIIKDNKVANNTVAHGKSDVRESIISYSKKYIGVPYRWGGIDPSGFDCSGFTCYVMKEHGLNLPRIAGDQMAAGKTIKLEDATKGDLIFFGTKKNVQHVGIVVSEPGEELTMIHASSSRGIMVSNVAKSSYWKPKLLYASRVID